MMVFAQHRLDRGERTAGGRHFACGPKVVMRGAFVANRGARHHDIANVDCTVQHSRAAANDELAASERDDALKARDGSGCANPGMDHGETPAAVVELVNRVIAHLALAGVEMARSCALAHEFSNYLLEETQHAMLGDIDRLDDARGLDDRDARSVEFQERRRGPGARYRLVCIRTRAVGWIFRSSFQPALRRSPLQ